MFKSRNSMHSSLMLHVNLRFLCALLSLTKRRMTGGVEGVVERMDDDCECGEGVMSGNGSGGAEGEGACESDVREGEVGRGERWVRVKRVKMRRESGVTLVWSW